MLVLEGGNESPVTSADGRPIANALGLPASKLFLVQEHCTLLTVVVSHSPLQLQDTGITIINNCS